MSVYPYVITYIYICIHIISISTNLHVTHIYIYIQYLQNIVFSLSSAGHSIWNSSSSGRFELCFFGHSIPLGTVSRSWRASPTACFMGKWTHLAVSMVIGVPPQSSILDWAYFPLWTYKPTIWGYTGYLHFRTPPSRWWRSWWASPMQWGFPKIGDPQNGLFIRENPVKMYDDWGYPYFRYIYALIFYIYAIQQGVLYNGY